MPGASQYIEFEGYFAEGVLGIFKIIRGFADLRDINAEIVAIFREAGTPI
jgi:hypothetical protein